MKKMMLGMGLLLMSVFAFTPVSAQTSGMKMSGQDMTIKVAAMRKKCMRHAYRGPKTGKCFCLKGYKMNKKRTRCYKRKDMMHRGSGDMPKHAPRGSGSY